MNRATLDVARWLRVLLGAGTAGLLGACGSGSAGTDQGDQSQRVDASPAVGVAAAGTGTPNAASAPKRKMAAAPDGTMMPVLQTLTRPDGLVIADLRIGQGKEIGPTSVIVVQHHGTLADGRIFDSSRGLPPYRVEFSKVIQGLQLGLAGMKVGGIRRLTVPPELAYGAKGNKNLSVPPNATLTFSVKLIDVVPASPADGGR